MFFNSRLFFYIGFYREEKLLSHVAMVAKCLDDNKPIKSLFSHSVYSQYFKLHRSYSTSFNLANLCGTLFWTVSIAI